MAYSYEDKTTVLTKVLKIKISQVCHMDYIKQDTKTTSLDLRQLPLPWTKSGWSSNYFVNFKHKVLISKELYNKLVSAKIEQALHEHNISKESLFVSLGINFEKGDSLLRGRIDWEIHVLYVISQKLEISLHKLVPDAAEMNVWKTDWEKTSNYLFLHLKVGQFL